MNNFNISRKPVKYYRGTYRKNLTEFVNPRPLVVNECFAPSKQQDGEHLRAVGRRPTHNVENRLREIILDKYFEGLSEKLFYQDNV